MVGTRGLRATSLVDGDIHKDAARFHGSQHLARNKLGCPRAGHQHGADEQIDVGQNLHQTGLARIERVRGLHRDIEKSHALEIHLENRHVRAQSGRHARRIDSAGAAAEDDDASGKHSGNTTKKHALSSIVFGKEIPSNEDGHPAGDFAHRFEERQPAVSLDRFVRDARLPRSPGGIP